MELTQRIITGNSIDVTADLAPRTIDLCVTSPPYFNARDYSLWPTFSAYMADMQAVFEGVYAALGNHRYCVVNVGDAVSQGTAEPRWAARKYALGAHFTVMLERIGFTFVDDYIWDKGEPQSKRHLGNPPYPFYQYPVNAYEHILVFAKHELDGARQPCPVCNDASPRSNSQTAAGIQSWECASPTCPQKSAAGRGKRYSARSIMMDAYKKPANEIGADFVKQWRRDIVKMPPVKKINAKGVNTLGHTAPFPEALPEMAIRYFSGVGDTVLDCFGGSGTTAAVAKRLGRGFMHVDMSADYNEIARKRIEKEEATE